MSENIVRPELASRIERLVGAKVESYRRVAGGYTPALRLLCVTAASTFFAKVATTPLTCKFLSRAGGQAVETAQSRQPTRQAQPLLL